METLSMDTIAKTKNQNKTLEASVASVPYN